ncbi:MAG: hypothetical protein QOG84_1407 [Sphingomonadales bacterium]|jgi:uncharacterized membrane protein|nr:hypothetical protein [Sphingomonadales bacterium]
MKMPIALFLIAVCAAAPAAARPPLPAFQASSTGPAWQLEVFESDLAISFGPDGSPPGTTGEAYLLGGVRHRDEGGILYWDAAKDAMALSVEARAGACTDAAGAAGAYRVTVRFRQRTLEGCGSVPAPRKHR